MLAPISKDDDELKKYTLIATRRTTPDMALYLSSPYYDYYQ